MNLLEVRGVSKHFGSLVAVRNVSLSVPAGELRAIIGPNGAGKTTFFNMISGAVQPTSGSVQFDGRDVTQVAPWRRVALGMARTFQITEIFPELTVAENLRIAVETASGLRLRPWIGRSAAARGRAACRGDAGADRAHVQGRAAGRRACAWRPARGRDRHGAGAAPAPAAAR